MFRNVYNSTKTCQTVNLCSSRLRTLVFFLFCFLLVWTYVEILKLTCSVHSLWLLLRGCAAKCRCLAADSGRGSGRLRLKERSRRFQSWQEVTVASMPWGLMTAAVYSTCYPSHCNSASGLLLWPSVGECAWFHFFLFNLRINKMQTVAISFLILVCLITTQLSVWVWNWDVGGARGGLRGT